MALQARARIAANGWRLPRGLRKSGISAKTSINGRACGIIAPAPSKRFGSCEGVPCQGSPHVVKTLYGPADTSCQLLRRKLNDPAGGPFPSPSIPIRRLSHIVTGIAQRHGAIFLLQIVAIP